MYVYMGRVYSCNRILYINEKRTTNKKNKLMLPSTTWIIPADIIHERKKVDTKDTNCKFPGKTNPWL